MLLERLLWFSINSDYFSLADRTIKLYGLADESGALDSSCQLSMLNNMDVLQRLVA